MHSLLLILFKPVIIQFLLPFFDYHFLFLYLPNLYLLCEFSGRLQKIRLSALTLDSVIQKKMFDIQNKDFRRFRDSLFHEQETSSSSFMEGFRCFLNAQLKTLISTGLNILGLKFKLDERELFIAINAITVVQNQ